MRNIAIACLALCLNTTPVRAADRVALSFDDGPDPHTTPQLLDMLKAAGVVATFCVVGKNVAEWPELVAREHAEGHELCNHSWDHETLTKKNAGWEVSKTDNAIQKAAGVLPTVLRAPYGNIRYVGKCFEGRPVVGWGDKEDTLDWLHRDSARVERVAVAAEPGTIVLMHDIRPTTIEAVPGIIAGLKARGFTFVTVSQIAPDTCGKQKQAQK